MASVARNLLLDCTLCYLLFVLLIVMVRPRYMFARDGARARNFGVSDKGALGVFAGVVPFAVAAILAVMIPLSARRVTLLSPAP